MKKYRDTCKAAVVQASPVLFNKEKTVEKTINLIEEAGKENVDLIVFPESFIPAYPRGFSYGYIVGSRTMEGRDDWKIYYDNSIVVPSEDTNRIGEAAKKAGAYVVVGISERDLHNTTLYCSYLIFSPEGELIAKHRKMKQSSTSKSNTKSKHKHEY